MHAEISHDCTKLLTKSNAVTATTTFYLLTSAIKYINNIQWGISHII